MLTVQGKHYVAYEKDKTHHTNNNKKKIKAKHRSGSGGYL